MAARLRSTRAKKPSPKLLESEENWNTGIPVSSTSKLIVTIVVASILTQLNNPYPTEWCKIFCKEHNKCHDTTIRNLEPEDSEVLKETDLVVGNSLLWKYRGKKYNATVIEIIIRYVIVNTSPALYNAYSHSSPPCVRHSHPTPPPLHRV